MIVLLTYDVKNTRLKAVRRVCIRYLSATQRSVFEGVLTEKQYLILSNELRDVIDPSYDAVTLYRIYPGHSYKREDLGIITIVSSILS